MPLFCLQQVENEIPDDETVNQIIARSEEEFEIFQVDKQHTNLSITPEMESQKVKAIIERYYGRW